jgi:hypothetical protein
MSFRGGGSPLALETSGLLERGLKRRTYIFYDVKLKLYIDVELHLWFRSRGAGTASRA